MGNKGAKNATRDLTEKEIELLSSNTGMSRGEILSWHKQFLSEYSDGSIDQKEFIALYKKLYQHGDPTKFAKFAFKAFDDDKSGKITFPEFVLSTSFVIHKTAPQEERKQRLELAFDIFDVDNNNKIDKSELSKLYDALTDMQGRDDKSLKDDVKNLFAKYDADGSKALSKEEFITAMSRENVFNYFG